MSIEARSSVPIAPVIKEVTVPLTAVQAFELFTARIASWWPLRTHSVFGEQAVGCTVEGWVGGQIFETGRDGGRSVWGTVELWDPPQRLAATWHPGRTPSTEQHLEVTFVERGGLTVVRLVHSGWERLGEVAAAEREDYERGWDPVLADFTQAATAGATQRVV